MPGLARPLEVDHSQGLIVRCDHAVNVPWNSPGVRRLEVRVAQARSAQNVGGANLSAQIYRGGCPIELSLAHLFGWTNCRYLRPSSCLRCLP